MIAWRSLSRPQAFLYAWGLVGIGVAIVYAGVVVYDLEKQHLGLSPRPEFATGDCARLLPERREFPEIGRLLALVRPVDCAVYRGSMPAGEILSGPGSYLSVAEGVHNQLGKGETVDSATLESARKILADAGWREVATISWAGDRLHAEFHRILADKTRQYLALKTAHVLKLALVSLPTPRIDIRLSSPAAFASRAPAASDDRFAELTPLPGFVAQGLHYADGDQYFTPADPDLGRDAYSWWAPKWVRTYRYDPEKLPPLAASLLYKDALRDAGWRVGKNYAFEGIPRQPGAHAEIAIDDRELVADMIFSGNAARIILTDVGFQRRVAAIVQQWKLDCVATVRGLEFAPGQSDLSKAAQEALETVLDARQVAGRQHREDHPQGVVLELRGRADPSGGRQSNSDLAMARANAVKTWLVERGVPGETLGVSAFGDWETSAAEEGVPRRTVSVAKLACTPEVHPRRPG